MNIFYLDRDPVFAAKYHCDKHVVKMVLETAQMLSDAHHYYGSPHSLINLPQLSKAHKNHPCTKWVRSSKKSYRWTVEFYRALADEYTLRYNKIHKTDRELYDMIKDYPSFLRELDFTDPPQVMPEEYQKDDTVEAYHEFYRKDKSRFAKWKFTTIPNWFNIE